MIMLTTGIHYDQHNGEYRTSHNRTLSENGASKYFDHNDLRPFHHIDFRHRHSMTPDAFSRELNELIKLGHLGIAPSVYGHCIEKSFDIHYAFIIMERVDCSLKDIYLVRELHHDEDKIIKKLINKLHKKHGIIHGDLKPSNIGVYLNKDNRIIRGCFFDCQKIKHQSEMSENEFKRKAERDITNFQKHIIKNRKEGSVGVFPNRIKAPTQHKN